ncbi:MAG: energy transducer TonB [Bacteroidales bacterium]|nr:energy transducer TonB [Bacteroidales bacterium]
MKISLWKVFNFFLIAISIQATAQEDTTYFYSANNRPADPREAVLKRTIFQSAPKKYKISTFTKQDNQWQIFSTGVIRIRGTNEFLVREYRDGSMEKIYTRMYSETPEGLYDFTEIWNDNMIRTGTSGTRIPLTLEGIEVKYYDNGQKKSESVYRNNQLVSNINWLKNGEKYIDNVFYSVDEYPEYKAGTKMLHKYLSEYIAQSGLSTDNLDGAITIGFVITIAGEIDGVYVAGGIMPGFDEMVAEAVRSIPGKWEPAILNNEKVNCFLTIPINFRREAFIGFDNLELSFSNNIWMLYW